MSGTGPHLSALRLWTKREDMCLAILERALRLLSTEKALPESEVDLNRRLYFCLLTASRKLYPRDPVVPVSECNNQPDPDDVSRVAREQKRPDFQWVYRDQYEPDPLRSSKQFVVECKRLGEPLRADWVFNLNYVKHGICRFRDQNWAYAQRFPSGAMVGYWQSMEANDILSEVNDESRKHSLDELVLLDQWNPGALSILVHTFARQFEVSPFRLRHLWIDLRPSSPESS